MNFTNGYFCSRFDWISEQQLNLSLFLSDWYCWKLRVTDLSGHNGKVTSYKKKFFLCHQRYKEGYRDYFSHFSVTLETPRKFLIVFVRLILGKEGVDGVTRSRREVDIRYQSDWKVILKGSKCKQRFLQPFLIKFPSNNQICYCFCQIVIAKSWSWRIYRATTRNWHQIWI